MQKLWIILLVLILAGATPAFANVIFYDDCENHWLLETDWLESNIVGGNRIDVSTEQSFAGRSSYKMTLMPFDPNQMSRTNVGLVLRGLQSPVPIRNFSFGVEYWMGFAIYIPANFNFPTSDNNPGLLGQFHGIMESGDAASLNPPIALGLNRATQGVNLQIISQKLKATPKWYDRNVIYKAPSLKKGAWNTFVFHFKFHYDSGQGAFFQAWQNGVLFADDHGANCFNDSKGPYFVSTIYAHADTATIMYLDEFRVGDARSSYNEVLPAGGGSVTPPPTIDLKPPALKVISTQ